MPVIFISQHSASDSNKPERNTCRFNQVTKHVKYLPWNKGVWHMKCEPPRSPLGDVIVSKLYLFTASDDTFKREKKSHPEEVSKQITLSGTSGGRRYKHRHTHTHTHTNIYWCKCGSKYIKWKIFKEWSLFIIQYFGPNALTRNNAVFNS